MEVLLSYNIFSLSGVTAAVASGQDPVSHHFDPSLFRKLIYKLPWSRVPTGIAANSFYITESHGFSGTSPSRLSVDGNPLIGPAPQDLLAPAPGMGAQAGAPHQHKYPNDPQDLSEGSLNRPDRLLSIPRLCSGSFLPKILEPRWRV